MLIQARTGALSADREVAGLIGAALVNRGRDPFADHYKARFDGLNHLPGYRQDAEGISFARDLESVRKTLTDEKYAVPNGLSLFPIDTSTPVGARTFTRRRGYEHGRAGIYRGAGPVPRVGVSSAEESFPVRHVVDGFDLDLFEAQSSEFAGSAALSRLGRAARNAIAQEINRLIWYGNDAAGLRGVLNYPYLPKVAASVAFDGSAAADDVIAELNRWANYPTSQSSAVFAPTRCVTSPRVRDWLMTKPRSASTDTSIGEYFTGRNAYIKAIDAAWECQGVGPGGTDAILFYRDTVESVAVNLIGGFSMLPTQRAGFVDTVHCYQSFGGVVMEDVGNNVLVWVTPPS